MRKKALTNLEEILLHIFWDVGTPLSALDVFEISCRTGEGLKKWYDWLRQAARDKKNA